MVFDSFTLTTTDKKWWLKLRNYNWRCSCCRARNMNGHCSERGTNTCVAARADVVQGRQRSAVRYLPCCVRLCVGLFGSERVLVVRVIFMFMLQLRCPTTVQHRTVPGPCSAVPVESFKLDTQCTTRLAAQAHCPIEHLRTHLTHRGRFNEFCTTRAWSARCGSSRRTLWGVWDGGGGLLCLRRFCLFFRCSHRAPAQRL